MWIITRLENLSGVYVECYRFLIFVVTDSVYYKYQYRLTFTLCSDLNSVSLYVTEIKEQPIFKRIRWQLRIFESVFYKSLIRACSFENSLAASQNARSNGQTSNHRHCEFVKNALKKCSCLPPGFFQIFVFLLFLSHTPEVYSNHYGVCMFYGIGIYYNFLFVIT